MIKAISGAELVDLIPQKPPFVLVSTLVDVNEYECTTTFKVEADHILCDNGQLNFSGLIENMAQTCAAKVSYEYQRDGKELPIGFIGDIKDFTYSGLPKAGEEIVTSIKIEHKIFDMTVISGQVKLNGEEIASCKMKIFIDSKNK